MRAHVFIALCVCANSASASTVWDESSSGDLSTNPLTPTPITLNVGNNVVAGTVRSFMDTRDYFTFSIAAGQQLTGIFLLDWMDVLSGNNGNRGFIHIDDGTTSVIPSFTTSGGLLGGSHLDRFIVPNTTTNLLNILAGAPQGGVGFSAPLGQGNYTINVQQTSLLLTAYSLDFVVIPAPTPAFVLVLAGFTSFRRRR